jgi:hypothetical protein
MRLLGKLLEAQPLLKSIHEPGSHPIDGVDSEAGMASTACCGGAFAWFTGGSQWSGEGALECVGQAECPDGTLPNTDGTVTQLLPRNLAQNLHVRDPEVLFKLLLDEEGLVNLGKSGKELLFDSVLVCDE